MGWLSHGCTRVECNLALQLLRQRHILVTQLFQWRNRAVITQHPEGPTVCLGRLLASHITSTAVYRGASIPIPLSLFSSVTVTLTRSFQLLCPSCHCVQMLSGPERPPARLMGVSSRRSIFSASLPAGLTNGRTRAQTHIYI